MKFIFSRSLNCRLSDLLTSRCISNLETTISILMDAYIYHFSHVVIFCFVSAQFVNAKNCTAGQITLEILLMMAYCIVMVIIVFAVMYIL